MKSVLEKINDALRAAGRAERLYKGVGYYYVTDVEGASSLWEAKLAADNATLQRVAQHVERVLKRELRVVVKLAPVPYVDGDTSPEEPEPPNVEVPEWDGGGPVVTDPPYVFPPDVPQPDETKFVVELVTQYGEPEPVEGSEFLRWTCPGCGTQHALNVGKPAKLARKVWTWNRDKVRPTLKEPASFAYEFGKRCAFTMKDGVVAFRPNCTHAQAGKKVPLRPLAEQVPPEKP